MNMEVNTKKNAPDFGEGRRALVIGVNNAQDALDPVLLTPLSATSDAQDMAAILEAEACGFKVHVLTGAQATNSEVKQAVRNLTRDASENDFLLLYFAGHGYVTNENIYLVTHDFTQEMADFDEHFYLSLSWLYYKLYQNQNAGKILLILDSCFSGNIGLEAPDLELKELKRRIGEYFNTPSKDSDSRSDGLRQALASTSPYQVALERDNHGMMTYHLLRALRCEEDEVIDLNNGNITLLRLSEYLQGKMSTTIQKPSLSGTNAGKSCILARYEERANHLLNQQHAQNKQPKTYIPLAHSPSFQHRPKEFELVTELLFPSTTPTNKTAIVVGITGMTGIGKTTMAAELAHTYQEQKRFPEGIFWLTITGPDRTELVHQLAELSTLTRYLPSDDDISSAENASNRAIHFCRYLASHTDVLLILDNVYHIEELLKMLNALAGELRCTILYTSQRKEAEQWIKTHRVEQLTELEALTLLLEYRQDVLAQVQAEIKNDETQAAREICTYVERLPMALILLRNLFQEERTLTLNNLWQTLCKDGALYVTSEGDVQKARLFTTFMQSWIRVELDTARILFKLATFFPASAPFSLWLPGLAAGLKEQKSLSPLGWARNALQRWSLIEVLDDGGTLRLHQLLHEFGKYLIQQDEEKRTWLEQADRNLWTEFGTLQFLENRATAKGYWNCLRDLQDAIDYLHSLKGEYAADLEKIGQWLTRESSLLGDKELWPGKFQSLFQQQLWNKAV